VIIVTRNDTPRRPATIAWSFSGVALNLIDFYAHTGRFFVVFDAFSVKNEWFLTKNGISAK